MRVRAALWIVGVVATSAGVSAAAFGQGSTWGSGAARPGAADAGPIATADAGVQEEEAEEEAAEPDAGAPSASAGATSIPPGDPGASGPSNLGFAIGLRGGYTLPFGNANGLSTRDYVSQGVVPVGVDVGWFFTPHFYVGAYFVYGIGVGVARLNDTCGASDTSCSAAMYRFGGVAHWHFRPETGLDPWVGVGLGYELVQITATGQVDGSSSSASLQGLDLALEAGLDFKPLRYLGLGPFVEVATGPYLGGASGSGLHGWATLGARFRLNLF